MIVGIIGSGGREHAICETLNKSKRVDKLYCFPGNAGTAKIAINIDININDFEKLKNFILEQKIDLVVVGPEKPLVDGIVDYLESFNIKVFGPNKIASQLEGSKIFTKKICEDYKIPTAEFGVFKDEIEAKKFLNNSKYPIVIKADNLASGKGVYICENNTQSNEAIEEIFGGKFGKAENVLIEEFLKGEEMSFFIISDGISYQNFGTAQDHKRVLEGDKGKNTGGMGAYSPSRLIDKNLEKKILDRIINPTLEALKKLGTSYKGFLYAGLMIVNDDPYLIEYNVRMGDPECQTILPVLNTDFLEIINSCCEKKLQNIKIEWDNKKSICVVLCSDGYPNTYKKNIEIKNLDSIKLKNDDYLFHAGTSLIDKKIFATGGRVLNFVSISNDFVNAKKNVYNNLDILNWSDGFYRKDIGFKVIDK
jgi:phosphoribosylamine--glycine ligase